MQEPAADRRTRARLWMLWCAVAFVVWNGVFDMRMHDAVRGYLIAAARAQAAHAAPADLRGYVRSGRARAAIDATAWALGIFAAGAATLLVLRRTTCTRSSTTGTPSTPRRGRQRSS